MAHIVEAAKSGRARCRTCGEGILKGELRFGEELPNAFSESGGTTLHWHHLRCAARKKPWQLHGALRSFEGEVPEREEIERLIAENERKERPSTVPYAERAPSGRSHCGECHDAIDKGALRVAVQREPDEEGPSPMMLRAPRYVHPSCARALLGGDPDAIAARIRQNSRLSSADYDELLAALRAGSAAGAPSAGAPSASAPSASAPSATPLSELDLEPVPF